MANVGHLIRRQSSRDLAPQRSIDRHELKEMRGRLMSQKNGSVSSYGATNPAFEDISPPPPPSKLEKQKNGSVSSYGATNATFDDSSPTSKTSTKGVEKDEKALFAPENGEEERESWDSKLTFLLATIGYAVGLGNVWRFPYLAQKNGGGAFLVPYFIMLAVVGIPMFYLELALGQRLRKGAIGVWNQVSVYLGGIGISSAVVSLTVALYYNTIIAWCLFYFFNSFQRELPWSKCPKINVLNGEPLEYSMMEPECARSNPTQYFWFRVTLMASEDINHPTEFNWFIAATLVVSWGLVGICMLYGIANSGKVVYVTSTFPYLVLIIFFFRGITLPGMSNGLRHLFTPKWHILADPVVWLEAGSQIFFSLGLAFGGLIAFSSYNPVNNNCYRDAVMVSLTNCFTSMFAAVVVFSIIGFKATLNYENCLVRQKEILKENHILDVEQMPLNVSSIMPECDLEKELGDSAAGTGLAFIVFTEAINQFPGFQQIWAGLFFLMLFTLGADSQFGTLEGVITSFVDMFPGVPKRHVTGFICIMSIVVSWGLFSHGAGNYVFILFDSFSGNFPLLIIALCECLAVAYIYGLKRFADDIELMTGSRPGLYWMICWKYLSPFTICLILGASVAELVMEGSGYPAWDANTGKTVFKEWPTWAVYLICFLVLMAIIWIPLVAICRLFGVVVIEDNEKARFPSDELKEFHGIVEHEITTAETLLFCIRPDGSEGLCCPIKPNDEY